MLRVLPGNVRLETGVGTHAIETSCEWRQACTPQPRCRQDPMSDSLPVHWTSSNQIVPVPEPYKLDWKTPTRLQRQNEKKIRKKYGNTKAIFRCIDKAIIQNEQKFCEFTGLLVLIFLGINHMQPSAKFEVYSFTHLLWRHVWDYAKFCKCPVPGSQKLDRNTTS